MKNVSRSTNLSVKIALLSAIALIVMYFQFPILPAYTFLKIDLSDIPALVGAFAFGPFTGAIIEGLKNILIILFMGTQTGGIGELANFVVGCAFVCTAGFIYRFSKTRKTALISLITATIVMTVAGLISNYLVFIPLYFKNMPTKDIIHYLIYAITPFNLIKGIIISVITLVIYKRVSVLIRAESLNNDRKKASEKTI